MNLIKTGVASAINRFSSSSIKKKTLILGILFVFGAFIIPKVLTSNQQTPQYQTSQAEKGTLIESVTASGTVTETNSIAVKTQLSGVIAEVYVNNGDSIEVGKPILKLTLDQEGEQKKSQAYSNYLSAKNNLNTAETNLYTLQADMFSKWDTFKELAENSTYTNSDGSPNYTNRALPEFHIPEKEWLAAEAKYKNQQSVIAQTQAALNSAWLTYQQSSDMINAPISGTVSNLSLQIDSIVASSGTGSDSSTDSSSSKQVAVIKTESPTTITINLTEIDVPKVSVGNKATLTFDAFTGKTFTGKVISIDTDGSVSSGVTSYPATIALDLAPSNLYSNMSASASIITNAKDNAVIIPNGAVQTQNDESTVRVQKNGTIETVTVKTGLTNDTQTEIISGISVGDIIITGQTSTTTTAGQQTTSPFGGNLRGGFGGNTGGTTIRRNQ